MLGAFSSNNSVLYTFNTVVLWEKALLNSYEIEATSGFVKIVQISVQCGLIQYIATIIGIKCTLLSVTSVEQLHFKS